MDKLKDLLVVMLVSALIGAVVGGAFQLVIGADLIRGLLTGAAAGLLIGLVSNYAFILVYLKLGRHPLWAGLAVSAVIALGTAGFALVSGMALPWPGAAMISVSVLAGLAATAVIFRNAARLNRKLAEKKRTLGD
jgi:hypothetical protein